MRENLELIKKEIEGLKAACFANMAESDYMNMSAADLQAGQCALRLVDHLIKYEEEHINAMERLEKKLDALLKYCEND